MNQSFLAGSRTHFFHQCTSQKGSGEFLGAGTGHGPRHDLNGVYIGVLIMIIRATAYMQQILLTGGRNEY